MLLQSLDPRRAILCGRANAERLAIRMTANSGQSHAVVRTDSKLQPFCFPVRSSCRLSSCRPSRTNGALALHHLFTLAIVPISVQCFGKG